MAVISHLCLLDAEPVNSVTPLLDTTIPSDRVVISYLQDEHELAKNLEFLLKRRGVLVKLVPQNKNMSVEETRQHFSKLMLDELNDCDELWFNASDGDHQSLLVAYDVAKELGLPCFVVDMPRDSLQWLQPANRASVNIADKLKLHEHLALFGSQLKRQGDRSGIGSDVRQLGAQWAMQVSMYSSALAQLNFLAYQAKKLIVTIEMPVNKYLKTLLLDLEELRLIQFHENNRFEFKNESARFFANGGWLELWVAGEVRGLRQQYPHIQDDGHSIEVERDGVPNEIDVAFLADNNLHLIECKTKRFNNESANQALYKIDSLADMIGGLHAKGMLVSYQPVTQHVKSRAKELAIEIVDSNSLGQLKSRIGQWVDQGQR